MFEPCKPSYERGCQENSSPFLPYKGRLFDGLHPAQWWFRRGCGRAAYFLSVPVPWAGLVSWVSCSDGGSTHSARDAAQTGELAPDNWEAPRAPTQRPRPIQGDANGIPFCSLLAETPYRERHQSAKSWGYGGNAPVGSAAHSFPLKKGRTLIMH